jgi:hypothetical protein
MLILESYAGGWSSGKSKPPRASFFFGRLEHKFLDRVLLSVSPARLLLNQQNCLSQIQGDGIQPAFDLKETCDPFAGKRATGFLEVLLPQIQPVLLNRELLARHVGALVSVRPR